MNNLTIIHQPIESLIPYTNNARSHTKQQINQLANSIRAFGFINPVVIDESNQLVAGHGRLLAAEQIGLSTIPCVRVEHLTDDEKRAYILADNKLAENAGWDNELLRIELSYLAQVDVDINVELTGFVMPEIDLIMSDSSVVDEETPVPPLSSEHEVITQSGDLWKLGRHRLLCADCLEIKNFETLMAGKLSRMVFTDPPYNVAIDSHARGLGKDHHDNFAMACGEMNSVEFTEFLSRALGNLAEYSLDGALVYACIDWRHLTEMLNAGNSVFTHLINLCVWNKSSGGMGSLYRSKHELVLVFKHGKASHINNIELGKYGRNRTNVWDYPGANAFGADRNEALAIHPTVKPVRLVADAILDASKRGDIVLDSFTGSGSTLLATEQTGRVFYGLEIDPKYVDVSLKRWIQATGEQPTHTASGLTYAERCREPACA